MKKVDAFIQEWLRHRRALEDLLGRIGDEHIDYKPWDGAFPLGALAVHIADAWDMFLGVVRDGAFQRPSERRRCETMDAVRSVVAENTKTTQAALGALDDSKLERTVEVNGFVAPGKVWLDNARDHEIHHKGQLFLYARLVGVEKLPFFIVQPPSKR